ncbi:MAG: hypothetical protein Q8R11_03580 [bacterium]|nr:hypothetical protein [bacterium]
MQIIGVIRDRGQLTIPEEIRAFQKWARPASVVTIASESSDKIVIRPHRRSQRVDWESLWHAIDVSRSFQGKRGNLSAFIAKDREKR